MQNGSQMFEDKNNQYQWAWIQDAITWLVPGATCILHTCRLHPSGLIGEALAL